ncbi:MAG: FkbM family methyltransferase [Candidatus Lokiarchaeota archaeon]|nr:FkbM family methyltransferase [Candidatus Lokiarchaeota archaeon]
MKSCKLPNGETCYYIDKLSALKSYEEIFNACIYENHGLGVKDGDLVFDVGANIGMFTRFISKKAKDLTIYTFEPIPAIFKVQEKNLELIKRTHKFQLFNIGLGNKEENIEINYYPRAITLSAIIPIDLKLALKNSLENWDQIIEIVSFARFIPKFLRKPFTKLAHKYMFKKKRVPIKVRPLSDIIKETKVNSIDFLKMDAENYEWQILQGISDSDWKLIKQIAMEVHTNIAGGNNLLQKITNLLLSKDFTVYHDRIGQSFATGVYMLFAKKNNLFKSPLNNVYA